MTGQSIINSLMFATDRLQTLTTDTDYRTMALDWVNRTLENISAQQDRWWWRFLEKTGEFDTIVNIMSYNLPDDIDTYKVLTIRDKTNDFPIKFIPIEKFDRIIGNPSESTGQPVWFTLWADVIKLYPVPAGIYTTDVRYIKKITLLTDDEDSTTDLPDKWTDVLLQGALVKAHNFDKDSQAMQICHRMYLDGLDAMKIENNTLIAHIRKTNSHRGQSLRQRDYDQSTLN